MMRSTERLSHFNCGKCRKWWSASDIDENIVELYCPFCGLKSKYENIS